MVRLPKEKPGDEQKEYNLQMIREEIGRGEGLLWSIDFMPGGALLVTQRDGVLWHFDGEKRTAVEGTPEVWQHGQGGLLEVALHPDYADNGWVYLSYSENTGATENGKEAGMTTVVRGRIVDGRWLDVSTAGDGGIFRTDNPYGLVATDGAGICDPGASQVFFADLVLRLGDETRVVSSRPSDAIAVAVTCDPTLPIYVSEDVLDEALSDSG